MTKWRTKENEEDKDTTTCWFSHFFLAATLLNDSSQLSMAKNASLSSNDFNLVWSTEDTGTRSKDSRTTPPSLWALWATYISSKPI